MGAAEGFGPVSKGKNWKAWRSKLQLDILEAVSDVHSKDSIDLCLAYGSYTEFEPETLNKIRKMGIPAALLWLDEKHAFWERPLGIPNGQKPLIGSCDVHLTNSFECIRWYMAEGAAAYYFPQAIDPEIYRPLNLERDIPVSFMGAAYGARIDFIRKLKKAGIPIQCFGAGWERGKGERPDIDNVEIYCRSIVNLGIGATGHSERLTCVKGRDFEVPAVGGFYLTTYDYELSRLFYIGKEIVCYRNVLDCIELIRYYLERPEEAQEIGEAGRQRILAEHTWTHRMVGLLKWMGILGGEE